MLGDRRWALGGTLAVMVWILVSCAGPSLKVEPISPGEDPKKWVNDLANDLQRGKEQQLNVLSPTWFGKAEASLKGARKGLAEGIARSKILDQVARGKAQLHRAKEAGKLARTALAEVIGARERARKAGATQFPEEYQKAEDRFLDLTKAIEDDNLGWAQKNKAKAIDAFDRLEILAIKERALGETRKMLDRAKEEGLWKLVPQTYKTAQGEFESVNGFIAKNRYQDKEIQKRALAAEFQARRLLEIARETKKIQRMQPEQVALWIEGMLHQPTIRLSAPDRRDRPFARQVENILSAVEVLQKDREKTLERVRELQKKISVMEKEIASLEGRSQEERVEKERLEAEKRLRQLYNRIRRQFGPTEAEVYTEGNRLVIRLKAIQFPSGKAVIMPRNYALLSKVQHAIRTFGQPEVVVEGHTDSVGPEKTNERLSQQRAEAVREYFVANGVLPYDKISAVGYGSKRPLASNATAEGRAINRRIDILITPEKRALR